MRYKGFLILETSRGSYSTYWIHNEFRYTIYWGDYSLESAMRRVDEIIRTDWRKEGSFPSNIRDPEAREAFLLNLVGEGMI